MDMLLCNAALFFLVIGGVWENEKFFPSRGKMFIVSVPDNQGLGAKAITPSYQWPSPRNIKQRTTAKMPPTPRGACNQKVCEGLLAEPTGRLAGAEL